MACFERSYTTGRMILWATKICLFLSEALFRDFWTSPCPIYHMPLDWRTKVAADYHPNDFVGKRRGRG
jgi:hypothetical protein